jgi:plasmid replication initiation protein
MVDLHRVSMSNEVIRASHDLTLSEKRLIAFCLAETDSINAYKLLESQKQAGFTVKVVVRDYAECFDIEPQTAYEQIKTAAQKIFDRYIRKKEKNKRGLEVDHFMRWVSSAKYADGQGWLELRFTPEIAPHVLALRQSFTSYRLKDIANLDTTYSWRLYELLRSWLSTGVYSPKIDEFYESMSIPPSLRKNFADLRRRVLDPAIKAINDKTDLKATYEPITEGSRKVVKLRFTVKPDLQTKLSI